MSGRNYYLLPALPSLGELGSEPPISLADFLEHLSDAPKPLAAAQAVFLGEDLRQREALLAGELKEPSPTVLTAEQVRDEAPLPDFLAPPADEEEAAGPPHLAIDRVWGAYFRYLAHAGRSSAMIGGWTAHEVGLRNALAAARAKALGLDSHPYLVEPALGLPEEDFAAVLGEWASAETPLAALRILDQARWAWIAEHDSYFLFADDELAAYAARLMLLHRWKRIADAEHAGRKAQAEERAERRP